MMERSLTILRWSAGLGTALASAVLIALTLSHSGYLGATGAAIDHSAERIVDLLMARSPDRRTTAELTKTKGRSARAGLPAAPATPDSERMLGKTFPPDNLSQVMKAPEELLASGPWPEQISELPEIGGPFALGETPFQGVTPPGTGIRGPGWIGDGFGGGGSSGGGSGGGSSGGGSSGGGEGGTVPPPPVVAAIPEPSTWITMTLGVLLCAGSLRRRNRLVRRAIA